MAEPITITIDGQTCTGSRGQTILEVARANGVDIPTLCYHPWLSNHGACRMCVVQVEGERRLVTACAAPARDGMVVVAKNDELSMLRQMTLELLFAERNHICPFCAATGNCELQDRAYQEGITHTRYQYLFPVLEPDTSNRFFVQDHNRCILCGRCVRACDEIAGIGTLGFGHRGSKEVIIADLGVPLGESTCISCGTCVDVCPTGALFDKRAPYFAKGDGLVRQLAVSPDDDLGCVMAVILKSGLIASIEGAEEAPVNGPLLSRRARYEMIFEPTPRVLAPQIRNLDGKLEATDWSTALDLVGRRLGESGRVAGLASGRLPRETMSAFQSLLREGCGSGDVDTLSGRERLTRRAAADIFGTARECGFDDIRTADMVLLVGFDPVESHPVLGAWLAGMRHHRQVPIVSINARSVEVAELARLSLKPRRGAEQMVVMGLLCQLLSVGGLSRRVDRETQARWLAHPAERVAVEARVEAADVTRAAKYYAAAKRPVILYGPDLLRTGNPQVIGLLQELARLSGHLTDDGAVMARGFTSEANGAAAESLGLRGADLEGVGAVYLLAGDDRYEPTPAQRDELEAAPFVVLQASHVGPLTEFADVVLPSLKWSERGGTWVNATGLEQSCAACCRPPAGVLSDDEVLAAVAARLRGVEEAVR